MRQESRSPRLLANAALVVTWSSGFVGAELSARAGAATLTFLTWRFVPLALGLALAFRLARLPWPSRAAWRRQLVVGLLCQPGYLVLVFEGVAQGVSGGTAALIAALQPLLVATVAGRLVGEPSTPRMKVGMLLGLAGVAVAVSGSLSVSGAPWWAYLLPVAGMLCLAAGTVLERRLPPDGLFATIMMQGVVTAVALLALAALLDPPGVPTATDFWVAVVWSIVLASLGGYVMYVHVTQTQGATVASTLLYLTPPTTMLWVWLMFGVPITPLGVVGLGICAAGVWLVVRRSTAEQPDEVREAVRCR
jgi:drug/metabolite transporter (DMT)-like permease